MHARLIAISDIHGHLTALRAILAAIAPNKADTIVTLGDYIDRGPDSRGVINHLMQVHSSFNLVPLLGNHDEMMLKVYDGRDDLYVDWLLFGGSATLTSYDTDRPEDVLPAHIEFLRGCRLFHESEQFFYLHGNYLADVPLSEQSPEVLLWDSVKARRPGPHSSGKTAIVGHASQKSGEILDLGYLKCVDTWCYGDGWLTALHIDSGQTWQADKAGRMRDQR